MNQAVWVHANFNQDCTSALSYRPLHSGVQFFRAPFASYWMGKRHSRPIATIDFDLGGAGELKFIGYGHHDKVIHHHKHCPYLY
jgi:hypothetical protein